MDHLQIAVCVIGHNEGRRLRGTLEAVRFAGDIRVFVDSASTDDSRTIAETFSEDIDTIVIGGGEAHTAALGRNRGFQHVTRLAPELEFVQFVDGDCTLAPDWLEVGVAYLRENSEVGIVAGRLRESDRNRNRYHRVADMEWNTPEGEVLATGGICLVRADAYRRVGGMDGTIARGEEAEFARRLRDHGYRVVRLPDEMAQHDIDMEHFSQWWRRTVRYGCGVTEELERDGLASRDALYRVLSIVAWGLFLPAASLGFAIPTHGWSLALLSLYLVLWCRVRGDRMRRGDTASDSSLYATAILIGKAANASGVILTGETWLRRRFASVSSGRTRVSVRTDPSIQLRGRSTIKNRVRSNLIRVASTMGALKLLETRMTRGLTTLMYHRVLPDELCQDYPLASLVIPVSAFKRQVRHIAEQYDAGTITQGLRAMADGPPTKPRVAISFDDGYRDNFEVVAPILEECGLRATFFATTDFVSTGNLMWFDEACLLLGLLGPDLSSSSFPWDAPEDSGNLMAWMNCLKSLAPTAREEALAVWRDALARTGGGRSVDPSGFGAMKPADLRELHAREHEIGSHSCSHPLLSQLSPEDVARELTASRVQLEEWIDAPVVGFCYPNGDNDDRLQRAVDRAGYTWACTANVGMCEDRNSDLALPRVGITAQHVLNRYGQHDAVLFRAQVCQFRGAMQHPWS